MKIYARQIPPEGQDNSYMLDDDYYRENIVLLENRNFRGYGYHTDEYERAEENAKYYDWETVKILFQLYTGKRWEKTTIRGCCQGDWQECLYCPDAISNLYAFETIYFNTGTEFSISFDNPENEDFESIYCVDYNYKREIADAYGVKESDVVLYEFTGYKKIPQYKEA